MDFFLQKKAKFLEEKLVLRLNFNFLTHFSCYFLVLCSRIFQYFLRRCRFFIEQMTAKWILDFFSESIWMCFLVSDFIFAFLVLIMLELLFFAFWKVVSYCTDKDGLWGSKIMRCFWIYWICKFGESIPVEKILKIALENLMKLDQLSVWILYSFS